MITAAEAHDGPALEAARVVIAAAEAADGTPPVSDQALLAAQQGQRRMLLFRETGAGDGGAAGGSDPVAVGVVGQGEVDLVVRPEARGRGVGRASLARLLEHADGEVLAWAHGTNPAAEALLRATGFSPVRTLYRMALDPARLPGDGRDPLALVAPPGLALRRFDPERAGDAAAWVRVNAAAFASHPEQGRITEADFAVLRREPWFDAGDLILLADLAEDPSGDTLAGSTWIKTQRDGDVLECELYAVGVDPAYVGRGLGRLLLDVTLARMAQHRPERVTLYVDGENERAVRMYETAGFAVDSRSRQWRRPGNSSVRTSEVDARMEP